MKKTLATLLTFSLALPLVASAQALQPLANLIGAVARIVGALVPILITIALVVFFWGLVRYLWGKEGEAKIKEAKSLMIWGLVTLFVMVSVWGIVRLGQDALGINPNAGAVSPHVLYPQ
jgi:type IV secretion system pilin